MAILSNLGGKIFNTVFGSISLCCCEGSIDPCNNTNCCTNTSNIASGYCRKSFYTIDGGGCGNNPGGIYDGNIVVSYDPQNYWSVLTNPLFRCTGYGNSASFSTGFLATSKEIREAPFGPGISTQCYTTCQYRPVTFGDTFTATISDVSEGINGSELFKLTSRSHLGFIDNTNHCSGWIYNGNRIESFTAPGCSGGTFRIQNMSFSSTPPITMRDKHSIWGFIEPSMKFVSPQGYTAGLFGGLMDYGFGLFFIYEPKLGNLYYFLNCRYTDPVCGNNNFGTLIRMASTVVTSFSFTPALTGLCINGYDISMSFYQQIQDPASLSNVGRYDTTLSYSFRCYSGILGCVTNIGELA